MAAGADLLQEVKDVGALEDVRAVGGDEHVQRHVGALQLGEDEAAGDPGLGRRLDALEEAGGDPALDAVEADAGERGDAVDRRRVGHWRSPVRPAGADTA